MQLDLIAIALCLAGSAFFSGSETALTSLPITRLEALRQRSGRLTRAGLDRWATSPEELLITILVGNNLVNVLASALATRIADRITGSGGLALVVGVMTLFILVFGEITPKTLAQRHASWIAARVAPPLYLLDVVLRPVNRVLGLLTRLLASSQRDDAPVTEEDLLFMTRLAHRHAQLPPDSRHMIEAVLSFQRAVAREVMLPRPSVVTVDSSWDLEQLRATVIESGHSRFPVVAGSPDEIVGVLHAKQLLQRCSGDSWSDLMVPPLFIPESKPLPDLMRDFQESGPHIAIVLDEFGGFSGVVTLEDALELVVGEIEDEFDQAGETGVVADNGGWSVPGHLSLRRLERIVKRTIERPTGIDSIGGVVGSLLEDPLEEAASLDWQGLRIRITELRDGRPSRLFIRDLKRR
jgi:CBS domain containing-hemolysin-like protein